MIELTPEVKSKLAMLKTKIGDPKIDSWGQQFLQNVCGEGRTGVSTAQLNTINKMFLKFCTNAVADKTRIIRSNGISAFKTASGYQLYIDNKAVGISMTMHEAEVLTLWFEHSRSSLEHALKQEKPAIPGAEEGAV